MSVETAINEYVLDNIRYLNGGENRIKELKFA